MTAVIILNWNGYKDTIDCLRSLYLMKSDFFVLVVDNGSTDGSVARMVSFLEGQHIVFRRLLRGDRLESMPANRECVVYEMGENLGFAKGNNEGLRLLRGWLPDYALLLNNDTVVEPDFLHRLEDYASIHPAVDVLTPLICYYVDKNKVWNAGGSLYLGLRKYYYADQHVDAIKETDHIPVSFLTGCALFFRTSVLLADGSLLTERFFFGEEDFEFCLRMKKEHRRMSCVLSSKIYHKVSASTKGRPKLTATYTYYLNRYINIRQHFPKQKFYLWRLLNNLYICLLLIRQGFGPKTVRRFIGALNADCFKYDGVTKDMFEAMRDGLEAQKQC